MNTLFQDLKFGLRMLAKNPGFTAVAVLVLALGIGANTAIFSLLDQAILRSLSVRDPGRLVVINDGNTAAGGPLPMPTKWSTLTRTTLKFGTESRCLTESSLAPTSP